MVLTRPGAHVEKLLPRPRIDPGQDPARERALVLAVALVRLDSDAELLVVGVLGSKIRGVGEARAEVRHTRTLEGGSAEFRPSAKGMT